MNTVSKSGQYVLLFLITTMAVVVYLFCHKVNMTQPIALDMDKTIDGFISAAAMNDNGTVTLQDCEYNLQNAVMFIMIKVCKNVWIGINAYYILTFFMISFSMYHFLAKMGIPFQISMGIAVLTAFVPFHVDRGEGQMLTSNFFLAPLFLELFYELIYCNETTKHKKEFWLLVFGAPFIDARISVMACIILIMLLIQRHDMKITVKSMYYLFPLSIITAIIMNITVNIRMADIQTVRNEGMRILDMVEPMRYHVLDRLSDIRLDYDVEFSANGESGLNSMGMIFTFGFICMMFGLFMEWKKDKRIAWMGMISIFIIIIASISGINLILEYFGICVTYWNRMAIFIIVCSAAVLGIILENVTEKVREKWGKAALTVSCIFVGVVYVFEYFELILRQNM